MRKILIPLMLISILSLAPLTAFSETIDVLIKGVDDGVKTNKQQDYMEALMNAKLQAIERAGVEISSITRIENFKLKYDAVESKAEAVLMPGFQVIDMGYQQDGTYQVVLSGKVQVGKNKEEEAEQQKLRFLKTLYESGNKSRAKEVIDEILIDSKSDYLKAEVLALSLLEKGWCPWEEEQIFLMLKSYYPNYKKLSQINSEVKKRKESLMGIGTRLITCYNSITLDTKTGLEWIANTDIDTTWHSAKTWAENLSFYGGSWRMPTETELKSLFFEKGLFRIRHVSKAFKITRWNIWSGETKEGNKFAWATDEHRFNGKKLYGCVCSTYESEGYRAFAVRIRK